jgi:hypothetical protein
MRVAEIVGLALPTPPKKKPRFGQHVRPSYRKRKAGVLRQHRQHRLRGCAGLIAWRRVTGAELTMLMALTVFLGYR